LRTAIKNTTPYHPHTNAQAELYNKTIDTYPKTQVLNSTYDWEQCMVPVMFAYSTSYHCGIKTTPLEVTFEIEPRSGKNPNPDLRMQYREDLGVQTCYKD
jgi:hypothetical protein